MSPFRIVEVIYDGFTQLDFTAPHTVLSRLPATEICVASPRGGAVSSDGGLVFAGTRALEDVRECDLLFLPGGRTTLDYCNDPSFIAHVHRLGSGARYLTSVCTGSLALGAAGFLRGRRAACHWAWRDLLPLFGAIPDSRRVVKDGNIYSGGGVTAGLDFALVIAAELAGPDFAEELQLMLEYAPEPPFHSGRPELARPAIRDALGNRIAALMQGQKSRAEAASRIAL